MTQTSQSRPFLPTIGGVLLVVVVSALFYIVPRLFPTLDPVWNSGIAHFYIVTFTSLVAAVTASFLLLVIDKQDVTAFFLTLAFLAMASLFVIHGVATPGIIIPGPNIAVGWMARLSLTLGALFFVFAVSEHPPARARWLTQYANAITLVIGIVLAALIVIVLLEPAPVVAITEFPVSSPLLATTTIGALLYAGYRIIRRYQKTGEQLYIILAVAFGWLVLAQISQYEAPFWAFSWWMYHIYMLAAYMMTMTFLVLRYEQKSEFRLARYFTSLAVVLGVPMTFILGEFVVRLTDRVDLRPQIVTSLGVGILLLVLALFVLVVRAQQILNERQRNIEQEKNWRRDMTSLIAHDLSSPVNAILLDLELLERTVPHLDTKNRDRLKRMHNSSRAVSELIFEMLNVEKMEAGALQLERQPTDLNKLVKNTLARVRTTADYREIDVIADILPNTLTISLDEQIIGRVVQNLLGNAFKFSPQGGSVQLSVAHEGARAHLLVADNGPGIPADQQEQIFERFGQARSSDQTIGFGLGLAFCKLAVEQHGGQIWVEANKPTGSIFHVTLPV